MSIKSLSQDLINTVNNVINEKSGDKEAYQKFFKSALKKFGVKSPSSLDDKKKKEFFDYIDKNWEGDNEKKEDLERFCNQSDSIQEAAMKNKFDNDYNRLIKDYYKLPWDEKPKTSKSSAITEYYGTIGKYTFTIVIQRPDTKWGPQWLFLSLFMEGNFPGWGKGLKELFNISGNKLLRSSALGDIKESDQKKNIKEFADAIEFIKKKKFAEAKSDDDSKADSAEEETSYSVGELTITENMIGDAKVRPQSAKALRLLKSLINTATYDPNAQAALRAIAKSRGAKTTGDVAATVRGLKPTAREIEDAADKFNAL